MDLPLDRLSDTPIYLQISREIRRRILAQELEPGILLPPERRLAGELGVNRSTVLSAYRELKREGLVDARVGRGTAVRLPREARGGFPSYGTLPWNQLFRERDARGDDPVLRDLMEMTERGDVIPMAIGLPAPELLPLELYRELMLEVLTAAGSTALSHSPTEGSSVLRETLSSWMNERGVDCEPSEVLVLSGSQQGLDLIARTLLAPGDTVVVEEPTYIGALQTFRAARARLVSVPIDEDGLRTDLLERVFERERPKLLYTLPTFQNPSGVVMSLERRRELLELCRRYQVPVVEDDPYSELRYDGEPIPSLKALDRHGLVVYLSTISKVLFPGLRLGWLVAQRPAVHQLALAKQGVDLHSGTPAQYFLDLFLKRGYYQRHLDQVCASYRRRRDRMDRALCRLAPDDLSWSKPDGGFYIWCRLPKECNRSQLSPRAAAAGVSFLPGWACYVDPPETTDVRLNFSHPPEEEIETGVQRFIEAAHECSSGPRSSRLAGMGTPPIV